MDRKNVLNRGGISFHRPHVPLSIDLLIYYPPTYLPFYLLTYLPLYESTTLPIYLPTYRSTYLPIYLHIYLSTYLPLYPSSLSQNKEILIISTCFLSFTELIFMNKNDSTLSRPRTLLLAVLNAVCQSFFLQTNCGR